MWDLHKVITNAGREPCYLFHAAWDLTLTNMWGSLRSFQLQNKDEWEVAFPSLEDFQMTILIPNWDENVEIKNVHVPILWLMKGPVLII